MNTTMKVPPRERLAAQRLRRRWSQLEIADQLGTTPGNVSRWERGVTSPGPYFRSKLCELFGKSAQELGLTSDESDDPLDHNTPVSSSLMASLPQNASSQSTSCFPDREDLLAHAGTVLRPDPTTSFDVSASSDSAGLSLLEHEPADQGGLVQAIMQWLQTGPNLVLILNNAETVVIVAAKEKGC